MVTTGVKTSDYFLTTSGTASKNADRNQGKFTDVIEKAEKHYDNEKPAQKKTKVENSAKVKEKSSKETDVKNTQVKDTEKKQDTESAVQVDEEVLTEQDSLKPEEVPIEQDFLKAEEVLTEQDFLKAEEALLSIMGMNMLSDADTDALQSMVAQELEVDFTQIGQAMEELGLQAQDLKEAQNLLKLMVHVMELSGPEEVLTNPQLTEAFKKLTADFESFFANLSDNVKKPEAVQPEIVQSKLVEPNNVMSEQMTESSESEAGSQKESGHDEPVLMQHTAQQTEYGAVVQNSVAEHIEAALSERVERQMSETIVKQVVEQVKVQVRADVTSLEMQLYPEHLGKVSIQVASKNGVLTAQIATETEAAKNALAAQIDTLKESLNEQGLKVDSVEVMVSSRGFDQNEHAKQDSKEQSRKGKHSKRSIVEELLEDRNPQETENVKETLGSTVSYTA